MTLKEIRLQRYWDRIAPDDLDEVYGKVRQYEDGFYLEWLTPLGDLVDREPIGDEPAEAMSALRDLAAAVQGWEFKPGWFVTMDDILRAEALLGQVPGFFEPPDW